MKNLSLFKGGMTVIVALLILGVSVAGYADAISGWGQIIGGSLGAVITGLILAFTTATWVVALNIDAAQLAAEGLVYAAMMDVTDKWEPEPEESYQKSAKANEDGSSCSGMPIQTTSAVNGGDVGTVTFDADVLTYVGLEAVGDATRANVIKNLSTLNSKGTDLNDNLTTEKTELLNATQEANYEWVSTAGITRALLGLESAGQALVDSGSSGSSEADAGAAASATNQTLGNLTSSVSSTARGMRVQFRMNLELAQRVNLTNMLQGHTLSIEAAKALRNSSKAN